MAGGVKRSHLVVGVVVAVGAGLLYFAVGGGGASLPAGQIELAEVESGRSFGGYVSGEASAPVEIVEYADFECPACRQVWVLTMHDVEQRLVRTGQVRVVFRDFPLSGHVNSRAAHHAAACMADQDKFWQMHDKLFETQPGWTGRSGAQRQFRRFASELGANVAEYDDCMAEGRHRGRIQASVEEGMGRGVGGTPNFFIGGRVYPTLTYDEMKGIVDSLAAGG